MLAFAFPSVTSERESLLSLRKEAAGAQQADEVCETELQRLPRRRYLRKTCIKAAQRHCLLQRPDDVTGANVPDDEMRRAAVCTSRRIPKATGLALPREPVSRTQTPQLPRAVAREATCSPARRPSRQVPLLQPPAPTPPPTPRPGHKLSWGVGLPSCTWSWPSISGWAGV